MLCKPAPKVFTLFTQRDISCIMIKNIQLELTVRKKKSLMLGMNIYQAR